MFIIQWLPKAVRQFKKIKDPHIRTTIAFKVNTLENFPHCGDIKMLKNHTIDYRLRVGRYRILFKVSSTIKIIHIAEVAKRDDQTY